VAADSEPCRKLFKSILFRKPAHPELSAKFRQKSLCDLVHIRSGLPQQVEFWEVVSLKDMFSQSFAELL
jgi:hypothetical protein